MECHKSPHLNEKKVNMPLRRCFMFLLVFCSFRVISQSQLNFRKVLGNKEFRCDTNRFKQELSTYNKYSTELQTICKKNELEIRCYRVWGVVPGWKLFIITYNKGQWHAYEYWYNIDRKSFDTSPSSKEFRFNACLWV